MTLDTRHNLLSVTLLIAIAAVVAVGLLAFWLLSPPDIESIEPVVTRSSTLDRAVASSPELEEFSSYAAIVERPVFFAGRTLPVMEVAGQDEQEVPEEPVEAPVEIPDLEARVAGIVITPEIRLAMVTDEATNETLVLEEGMALAGEKSAWKVASIRPRGVSFATDGGRSQDVELEVETGALQAGQRPQPRQQVAAEQDDAGETAVGEAEDAQAAARARAEEIRRRVAERRAQLREEAMRRAQQAGDG